MYLHLQFNIQVSNFSTPVVDLTLFVSRFNIVFGSIQHSSLRNSTSKFTQFNIQLSKMHVCLCDDGLIGCHAFISQLQTRGPIFSDSRWDSFIGSVGHSEPVGFFHQYEEDVLKVSRGPCDGAAIRPFGHHPDAFSVFRPQWFYLIGGVVLLIASLLISLLLVRQMV